MAVHFFNGTYREALATAKKENRKLFLYFTASWCGPCKYMEDYIFPEPSLDALFEPAYLALKIDGDTEPGKKLRIKYDVKGYPTFIIISPEEGLIRQKVGAMKLSQLRSFVGEGIADGSGKSLAVKSDSLTEAQYQAIIAKKAAPVDRLFFNASVSAWKPAFKFGISTNSLKGSAGETGSAAGYYFGGYFGRWNKHLAIEPGIFFNKKGGVTAGTVNSLHYLELPVVLAPRIAYHTWFGGAFQPIRFNVIPYGAMKLWSTQRATGNVPLADRHFTRFDYGTRFGISADMGSFEAFTGYDIGLSDISKGPGRISNRSYYFSAALVIGK
ncbi:thioredoxin family protein [Hufsiella ginkgonis]|uniref:Thioredoxin fold domain-containing protein n=1 Tax=Hufsiella ginkgonis TaxID=2695274 RepID=A0A7K1XTD2_9SPHI|nr:thioredoxin family protein [Hufsiella ginkgonis]MXV14271.1 thioredoxin fold domain-containing protein [Hufsiella ginkgonis]